MDQMTISAQRRVREAKGSNRRLRAEGKVPAVIYGGKGEPSNVTVDHHELELILRGARNTNKLFNLKIEGGDEQTIVRDIQRHPVNSRMIHVDFQRVDLESEIEVDVPVHVTGQAPQGVRDGGVLEHLVRSLRVLCKPLNIPSHFDADLSELTINHSFHVSDLKLPEGVQVLDEPETALFVIAAPKTEEAAAGAEGAAEPEVIGAKKEEKKPE